MKKINKIAAQDAARYIEANRFLSQVGDRFYTDKAYAEAFDNAYAKLQANQTSVLIASKMSSPKVITFKRVAIVAVAAVILHETGYDEVIWNNVKRFFKRAKAKAEELQEEAKETFPETAQKVTDLKDTVVDTAKTAAGEAKAAYGDSDSGYDTSYAPNVQKDPTTP